MMKDVSNKVDLDIFSTLHMHTCSQLGMSEFTYVGEATTQVREQIGSILWAVEGSLI